MTGVCGAPSIVFPASAHLGLHSHGRSPIRRGLWGIQRTARGSRLRTAQFGDRECRRRNGRRLGTATTLLICRAARKSESPISTETEKAVDVELDDDVSVLPSATRVFSYERLFSNLNQASLKHEPGNLFSAILLVSGTTVGAGILAIPAVTQDAGFLASTATCVGCWFFMVGTGLLVAEVNLNTMCELGSGGVSIVSMAQRTLGTPGVRVTCGTYLFIHFSLLVAYVSRSSEIISNTTGSPLWLSGLLFSGALGSLCYFASTPVIGIVNGLLVGGIITAFAALVGLAGGGLEFESLMRANWAAVPQSIPIIALSFVYQNIVPIVCTDLEGDRPKIRTAIILGTAIPLAMFIIWDAVILGNVSAVGDPNNLAQTVTDPLVRLQAASGFVGPIVQTFSLLAVATSYIGFVLGLSDFLSDLLKLPSAERRQPLPYLMTVVPPLALALTSPGIFFDALDFAGTYGVLVLFGAVPAAMAWSQRYKEGSLPTVVPPLVPGGRLTLGIIIGLSGLIISSELLSHLSL